MSTLAKAALIPRGGGDRIDFMFNPSKLAFEGIIETADNASARSEQSGKPMVSFSNIKAYKIKIENIVFDTFETGEDVENKYISKFKTAIRFIEGKERPPLYSFVWGSKEYLHICFVERVSYALTKFTADGIPVRAVVSDLTLKETEGGAKDNSIMSKAVPDLSDNMGSRQGQNR